MSTHRIHPERHQPELPQERLSLAVGAVASAERAFELALEYARERIMFDKPIAAYQLVQAKLVSMITMKADIAGTTVRWARNIALS